MNNASKLCLQKCLNIEKGKASRNLALIKELAHVNVKKKKIRHSRDEE